MHHAFELVRQERIEEYSIDAYLYRHKRTNGQVLSMVCDDENKVFGITFRTPPSDSTGVPHILEHSVLCGSRKYPVKEPFVELLKGSLQTFLNAFTYPDKTCYPVASTNLQDFHNLVDVYLDAVFYPRLTSHVLGQEGWHLDLDDPAKPLTYKGVVYNEMKGAYSSPESVLYEKSQQSLFPDTTYGLDSGGDPKVIPDLTFEAFTAFHRTYYHPSNARAFFYGDDPPEKRLEVLDEYFKEFEAIDPRSDVSLQPPFKEPKRLQAAYAAGADTPRKSMVTVNWLLPDPLDPVTSFSLDLLEFMLIGMPASPLRKALIDSGLGEDLVGAGLEGELKQMYFSTGLKGVAPGDEDKVEALILDTLKKLAEEAIPADMVEAALNSSEFRLRENNTGSYPRGLSIMLRSLTTWLHDGDPMALVRFEDTLKTIRDRLASGEKLFEGLIARHFLDNRHRTTLILEPDTELGARVEEEERQRLDSIRQAMDEAQVARVIEETELLRTLQAAPDAPEDLAKIPVLKVADLPRENRTIPLEVRNLKGVELLTHDIPTNGIVYLDLGFDLHCLPEELLPYAPLFGRALLEMGTDKEDYVSLQKRMARKTGGIHRETFSSNVKGSDGSATRLFLRGKATMANAGELLDILAEILTMPRLDESERFRQMVLEAKARQEQRLVPSGHHIVGTRLRARFNEADLLAERMHGVSNLVWVRNLATEVERNWPKVRQALEDIRQTLLRRGNLLLNLTLDGGHIPEMERRLEDFVGRLPEGASKTRSWSRQPLPGREGLTIPAQVNYVGKAGNLFEAGYDYHGSASVIGRFLRTGYLWDRVRVQGGAYGAFVAFDRLSGVFSFISYRDPNLSKTLEIYDASADFLEKETPSREEIDKAIVGAVGDIDSYLLPDAKGYLSMVRRLWGESDEDRQRIREEVMATGPEHFRQFAQGLRKLAAVGDIVVLGEEESLVKASTEIKEMVITRLM